MVRKISQKARGVHRRRERRLILLVVEGRRNKTESLYFHHYNTTQNQYTIRIVPGNETDPVKMVNRAVIASSDEGCDMEFGDRVYCVFDTDTDQAKQEAIDRAARIAESHNVELILSNPCFEVWYVLHYKATSRQFASNEEVLRELRRQMPNYDKNVDVFAQLSDRTNDAIHNARMLETHHDKAGNRRSMDRNPSTDVYRIVELLI